MIKQCALTIPVTTLGFEYDIWLNSFDDGLDGYRIYPQQRIEPIEGNLGLSLDLLYSYTQGTEWLAQIPPYLISCSESYNEFQYQLLWLAANSTAAKQLLIQRCVLLALICNQYKTDNTQALQIAEMGQRDILAHLGLDNSKSALKFLDKLHLSPKMGQALHLIREYLSPQNKGYLRFKHYDHIDDFTIFVDRNLPMLTGTKLGIALSEQKPKNIWPTIGYIRDTLILGNDIGMGSPQRVIGNQRSYAQLVELHDRWTQTRISLKNHRPNDADIPYVIPLRDCPEQSIFAIRCYDILLKESAEQSHCVVSYHQRIAERRYVVFTMQFPQRLTIGIDCPADGKGAFIIDQIRGKRNSPPSELAMKIIYQWLEDQKAHYVKQRADIMR